MKTENAHRNTVNHWTDRRHFLSNSACGLGSIALASLLTSQNAGASAVQDSHQNEGTVPAFPQFMPRAKRVIQIFSPGGVSQVDTFNYRPELERLDGQPLTGKGEIDTFFASPGVLRKSFFRFRQYGQSGAWVSDLFPHLSGQMDHLAVLQAMVAKSPSHQPACFQMNTGYTLAGFPSLGAWLSYGLGTSNENLPVFVVLPDPRGLVNGGTANWTNGFLPAEHQGTQFRMDTNDPVANLSTPASVSKSQRRRGMKLVEHLNRDFADTSTVDTQLRARLKAYELAARMQTSIPETVDFRDETEVTQNLYGIHDPVIGPTARNFLLSRRLIERGVRFVQIYNGGALGSPRINWDAHENVVENHTAQARLLDQPCAALLADLRQRGLMEDTLVVWATEFGRTPFTQGPSGLGRDHHQHAFTCWMSGAGIREGIQYGSTDEVGYKPAEHPTTIYDFHATILHLLGIDHEQLTFRHNGLDRRLTDVHGRVIEGILA
ncbi:MAG: DUF1501 domain-containing protein [Planctomyces sp.]|nr:DUF1501 domain-containing protein [Planctomyces sp.]